MEPVKLYRIRWHPHRANFNDSSLPKWHVHCELWGDETPSVFWNVEVYVPTRGGIGGLPGYEHIQTCGDANVWMECWASEKDIVWDDRTFSVGKSKWEFDSSNYCGSLVPSPREAFPDKEKITA